jgi:hypothetical protein
MSAFDASGAFRIIPESNQLRRAAIRGGTAAVSASGLGLLVQVVSTVILARLLTPTDFGVVTMVTTFGLLLGNFGLNGFRHNPSRLLRFTGPQCAVAGQLALTVQVNGRSGPSRTVQSDNSLGYILNSCDSVFGFGNSASRHPLVNHADGTAVSVASPAKAGETIVIYGVGFGSLEGGATGQPKTGYPATQSENVANVPVSMSITYHSVAESMETLVNSSYIGLVSATSVYTRSMSWCRRRRPGSTHACRRVRVLWSISTPLFSPT